MARVKVETNGVFDRILIGFFAISRGEYWLRQYKGYFRTKYGKVKVSIKFYIQYNICMYNVYSHNWVAAGKTNHTLLGSSLTAFDGCPLYG